MKKLKSIFFSALFSLLALSMLTCCKSKKSDDPQPSEVTFSTVSATFRGKNITPTPDYKLTVKFDAQGKPAGYTVSGSAAKQPTVGGSGSFSVNGKVVTFTSGSLSRQATIVSGEITAKSASVSLQWDLTKIDDKVSAEEQGTYLYVLKTK